MNQKKAKKLRKAIYGDLSLKAPRKYRAAKHKGAVHGYLVCEGPRRLYQMAKRSN